MESIFTKKEERPKISAFLMEVAKDFVYISDVFEKRVFHLKLASVAWNIACVDSTSTRNTMLNNFLQSFKGKYTRNELQCLRRDMLRLINKKLELHPDEKNIIIEARLEPQGDKDSVFIASLAYGSK